MVERDERDSAQELANLARTRRARGMSQQALAEKSGVSKSTIIRIEKGHKARISSAGKLAEALGTTVAELAGGAGMAPAGSPVGRAVGSVRVGGGEGGRYVLALARRRAAAAAAEADEDGEGGGLDLVEILGGSEALENLGLAMDRAREADATVAGLAGGPRLPAGGGASDEVIAQRDARYY